MEETRRLIDSEAPKVKVHSIPGDLGDMEGLPDLCTQLLGPLSQSKHKQCVLVNNAGTIDNFDTPFLSLNDPKKLQNFFGINLTSMITLTTRFLSASSGGKCYVVGLTSLLGTVFLPGFPLYSTAKASRNAFMGVLKAEVPDTRVLNYSPGPCDTEMYQKIPERFKSGFHKVLKPEDSVFKLIQVLKNDQFENGSTIDYFD